MGTKGLKLSALTKQRMSAAHTRHGFTGSPEHSAYLQAKWRCTCVTAREYPAYGGRGINFLFSSFEQFILEIGARPSPKHSLDRINVESHYMPGNVRWATQQEQLANRRQFKAIHNFTDSILLAECKRRGLICIGFFGR